MLKRFFALLLVALFATTTAFADDASFNVKIADAKGTQSNAMLVLADSNKNVVIRVADHLQVGAFALAFPSAPSSEVYAENGVFNFPSAVGAAEVSPARNGRETNPSRFQAP